MAMFVIALLLVLLVAVLTRGRTRPARPPGTPEERSPPRIAAPPETGAVTNGGAAAPQPASTPTPQAPPATPREVTPASSHATGNGAPPAAPVAGNGTPAAGTQATAAPGPRRERQIDEIVVPPAVRPDQAAGEGASQLDPVEPAPPAREQVPRHESALERAERLGDSPTLARLLIEQGEEYLAGAQLLPARDALQRALMVCHALRDPELEALARLNLGDLAEREGDLTSACEHWQLARRLFSGAGRRDAERIADERMRRTQCPTDWVLDDF